METNKIKYNTFPSLPGLGFMFYISHVICQTHYKGHNQRKHGNVTMTSNVKPAIKPAATLFHIWHHYIYSVINNIMRARAHMANHRSGMLSIITSFFLLLKTCLQMQIKLILNQILSLTKNKPYKTLLIGIKLN